LPLIEELLPFWNLLRETMTQGLLYQRRSVIENREHVPFCRASLADLIQEFQSRCSRSKALTRTECIGLRDQLLGEAGGLKYDHIEQEFHSVARRLRWPCRTTLKDFRHAFATMLGNTPIAEAYKKYLMGQSPGKSALNAYTHLNQVRDQFQAGVKHGWPVLIEAIQRRVQEI
jgi:hypothetical protein